jgi:hypothetical protein
MMTTRVSGTLAALSNCYARLKKQAAADAKSSDTAKVIGEFAAGSLNFLSTCQRVPLVSRVPDKNYFSFTFGRKGTKLSRAVNTDLFDPVSVDRHLASLIEGTIRSIDFQDRSRFLYTLVMSYCCAADLLKSGDQKTPATYFECLIGHFLARSFGVNPRTQVEVLQLEEERATLPTDFIYDLGQARPKFHVPVKTSTRERVIQVFAHQRVLDGVHGFGKFKGMLVCLTETKLDHASREVIEICVPKQWNLYYRFIAVMHRFYYFDIPRKYEALARGDPPMPVKSFASFFEEAGELAAGH